MSRSFERGLTPRLKPLHPRRSAVLSVLDIGTNKVVCLVAKLKPHDGGHKPRYTHKAQILGIGHQRSRGIKAGAVVDMEQAEQSIRLAVDAAERMAGVRIESVIANVGCGRIASEHYTASVRLHGSQVSDADMHRVLDEASTQSMRGRRAVLHSLPVGHSLDGASGVRDPRGMLGHTLGVDMHVVTAESSPARNLMLAVERCHLTVDAMVATPYASGLAAALDDEADMGVTLIDMGAGTTSVAVFKDRNFVHADALAVGGVHVTMDIARGLSTSVADAERLKILYGSVIATSADEREALTVQSVAEDERDAPLTISRAKLIRIIRPRVEEILELVRDRLDQAGAWAQARQRVILTGGACQLPGVADLARQILGSEVRLGRPPGVDGLPEAAKGPAFSTSVGLLVYPQVAGIEHFEPQAVTRRVAAGSTGYVGRISQWLKNSF